MTRASRVSKAIGVISVLVISIGVAGYWHYRVSPVPKPPLWGLSDPPVLENFTWVKIGSVEITNATIPNAPEVYGESMEQLKLLGYSLYSGDWSRTSCQWGLWVKAGRAYYIAYNGTRLLSVRGKLNNVINSTERYWLCGRPLDSNPVEAPTPEIIILKEATYLASRLMENNISIKPGNWTGPIPDWYLSKVGFTVDVGDGVEILMLLYSSESQVKYAEYLMKRKDRGLEFLTGDAGDYVVLTVLKGRRADLKRVKELLTGSSFG